MNGEKKKYDIGKEYSLSDVVINSSGKIIRIGEYYLHKNGPKSKTFNMEFLKGFGVTNSLKPQVSTKESIMECIVAACRNRNQAATGQAALFQNKMITGVLIEDDSRDITGLESTGKSDGKTNSNDIADKLGGLKLGGGENNAGRVSRASFLDEVKADLKRKEMEYKKMELVISLTKQIESTYDRLQSLTGDNKYDKELEAEQFLMLEYFWKKQNELMTGE